MTLKLSILRMFAGHTGSNAIPQLAYRTAPSGDTGPRGRSAEMGRCLKQHTPRPNPSGVVPLEGRSETLTLRWKAVSRPSVFTRGSVCGNIELPEQEARDVGIFLDDLVDGATAGVSGLRVVEKRDRTVPEPVAACSRAGSCACEPWRDFCGSGTSGQNARGACVRDFPLWQFATRTVSLNNRQKRAPQ